MDASLDLAIRSLKRNPTRTGLTVLGLSIGVAAFIGMVSFGSGARASVVGQFEKLGVNMITVSPVGVRAGGRPAMRYDDEDVRALRLESTTLEHIVPIHQTTAFVTYRDRSAVMTLRGTVPEYAEVRSPPIESGGFFDAIDVQTRAKVCVLGATTASQLFGDREPLGEVITVQDRLRCRVIGVARSVGKSTSGRDLDDFLVLPHTTFRTYVAERNAPFDIIDLRPKETTSRDLVRAEVTEILRRTHRLKPGEERDFMLLSPDDAIQVADNIATILTGLLASIAGVSLLVGGIGIMNIQLVSVTERTQEIGIRAAIGAKPAQILQQFLLEAVVLALIGTILGTIAGTALALVVADAMRWPTTIPVGAIVTAILFGLTTGVLFGFLPAQRAARLDPIAALRRE